MIKLINKAKNGIENVNTIDIKINYSNILDEDIIIYFKYFLFSNNFFLYSIFCFLKIIYFFYPRLSYYSLTHFTWFKCYIKNTIIQSPVF